MNTIDKGNDSFVIIQDAVSRHNSIRSRISDLTYLNLGLGVFGVEGVPYSTGTGRVFTKKLADGIISRLEHLINKQDFLHFYELGAGTGIFSKFLLDYLASNYPQIYKRITIHISDISPSSIHDIEKLELFKEHNDHVTFEIMDATKPVYTYKPDLIYLSYLMDSLPTHHFEIDESGDAYEVLIRSKIPSDASIIDTSQYPPIALNANQIKELYMSDDHERQILLAHQLLPLLSEQPVPIPIASQKYNNNDQILLNEFIKSLNKDSQIQFNFSFIVAKITKAAIKAIGYDGMLFISDFGDRKLHSYTKHYSMFGNIAAWPLCFPIFENITSQCGVDYKITRHPEGTPQQILICKSFDMRLSKDFEENFIDHGGERVLKFITNVNRLFSQNQSNAATNCLALYNALPHDYKTDFESVVTLTDLLEQSGYFTKVIEISEMPLENYGHVGLQLHIIRGRAFYHMKKHDKAKECFMKALDIGPTFALSYYYLSLIYKDQGEVTKYIEAKKCYLRYSRNNDALEVLWDIAKTENNLNNTDAYNELKKAIIDIGFNHYPNSDSETEVLRLVSNQ